MEYIITRAQLYKVMTKFLNNFKDNHQVHYSDDFIYIANPYENEFNLDISYDYKDGELAINLGFLNEFMSWFPINKEDAEDFIKDWFEQTYHVTSQYVNSYHNI
jgi:hypothetical protein